MGPVAPPPPSSLEHQSIALWPDWRGLMRLHMVPLGVSKASQVDAPVAHSLDQPGLSELHLMEAVGNSYILIHSLPNGQ